MSFSLEGEALLLRRSFAFMMPDDNPKDGTERVGNYKDYLGSEHWKKTRASKRARTSKCAVCGEASRLDVHHLTYRNLIDVELSDLRVLCRECHALAHDLHGRGAFVFTSEDHNHRWSALKAAVRAHFKEGHARPQWNGIVTQKWLIWHSSDKGGWTRKQLAALGVKWPPEKGWLSATLGVELPDAQRRQFERGPHVQA